MTVPNLSAIQSSTGLQTDMTVPGWQPDAIGLPRAVALAAGLVGLLMGGLVLLAGRVVPPAPPPPVTVQLMDAASAMSPLTVTAAPPPPAEAVPPPLATMSPPEPVNEAAPLPAIESLAPVPSPIAVATPEQPVPPPVVSPRPEPPRLRPTRRMTRPLPPTRDRGDAAAMVDVARDMPASLDTPHAAVAPPATADVSSGLGPYRAGLHRQIERNMLSDGTVSQLGVSGTAVIEATIARDGRVVSARLARSSGVRAIDDAALRAVQRGGFPPFEPHMPAGPITVSVPIGVQVD